MTMMGNEEEKKTAEEWVAELFSEHSKILDPDGWDRRPEHWEASWNEKITREEFVRRVTFSTCILSSETMANLDIKVPQ